jgi:hypothetical protein
MYVLFILPRYTSELKVLQPENQSPNKEGWLAKDSIERRRQRHPPQDWHLKNYL